MKLDKRIQKGSVVQVSDGVPELQGSLMVVEKILPDSVKCIARCGIREQSHLIPNTCVVYIGERAY